MRLARAAALLAKAGWTAADQALSALSNLVLTVVLAGMLDRSAFGAFSVAFVTYGIVVAVNRAAVGQVLQMRHSGAPEPAFRSALSGGLALTACIGIAAGIIAVMIGSRMSTLLWLALSALAVSLPGLVIQDSCRMACFSRGDAKGATILDAIWNGAMAVIIPVLVLSGRASLFWLTVAWGFSATVSAAFGLRRLRVGFDLRQAIHWWTANKSLAGYLLGEYVIGLGAAQLSILVAGVIASETTVGSLRGAQVVLGPLGILGTATFMFAIPELARRPHLTARRRAHLATLASGLLSAITLAYLAAVLMIPHEWGSSLFGETWIGARNVLLPMGISSFFATLATGPAVVLYGLGRARVTFWLHAAKAPLLLTSVVVFTEAWGASGAAIALAACEGLLLPAWIAAMLRAAAAAERNGPQAVDASESGTI